MKRNETKLARQLRMRSVFSFALSLFGSTASSSCPLHRPLPAPAPLNTLAIYALCARALAYQILLTANERMDNADAAKMWNAAPFDDATVRPRPQSMDRLDRSAGERYGMAQNSRPEKKKKTNQSQKPKLWANTLTHARISSFTSQKLIM